MSLMNRLGFFLVFLKVRENEMFYNVTQVTKYFKRCGLKKHGKMIRGKQVTLHFKRCGLKKYGEMICGKQVTLHFKRCRLKK